MQGHEAFEAWQQLLVGRKASESKNYGYQGPSAWRLNRLSNGTCAGGQVVAELPLGESAMRYPNTVMIDVTHPFDIRKSPGSQQTSTNDALGGGWHCHAVTGHQDRSRLSNRERRFGDSLGRSRPFHAGIGIASLIARKVQQFRLSGSKHLEVSCHIYIPADAQSSQVAPYVDASS